MTIRILSAESTERFVGTGQEPRQVLRVVVEQEDADRMAAVAVTVQAATVAGEATAPSASDPPW